MADRASNEPEVIEAARAGEPRALGNLYRQHADGLFRTVYRLTHSVADTEDVVHDVFVGLPEALRKYDERGAFAAWIRRVAIRLALMRMRAKNRRRETPLSAVPLPAAPERTDDAAMVEDFWKVLAALPEPLRVVFVLKRVEGYAHEEIAALLHITPGASRVRLTRALRALRRALQ